MLRQTMGLFCFISTGRAGDFFANQLSGNFLYWKIGLTCRAERTVIESFVSIKANPSANMHEDAEIPVPGRITRQTFGRPEHWP